VLWLACKVHFIEIVGERVGQGQIGSDRVGITATVIVFGDRAELLMGDPFSINSVAVVLPKLGRV